MPDYSRTIIYKLCCKDPSITDIYIGHTTDFRNRRHKHKYACINETNKDRTAYVYQFIRDHGGFDNWDMIEICKVDCVDKREAERNERKHIEDLGASLNKMIPTRTQKEYYDEHAVQILEEKKQYYIDNKEEILEKRKEYYIENIDAVKARKKKYADNNKDRRREYMRMWRSKQKALKEAIPGDL